MYVLLVNFKCADTSPEWSSTIIVLFYHAQFFIVFWRSIASVSLFLGLSSNDTGMFKRGTHGMQKVGKHKRIKNGRPLQSTTPPAVYNGNNACHDCMCCISRGTKSWPICVFFDDLDFCYMKKKLNGKYGPPLATRKREQFSKVCCRVAQYRPDQKWGLAFKIKSWMVTFEHQNQNQ